MKYQVLARKYRPKNFSAMIGQEHVLKALSNALESERLHHAYLFTGTRGVGKTTVARVLAKALNCEQGITAEPCGECSACREIDQGRFIDLLEVDAASRTKVEDTRDLLDNVQYAPTQGRYKIYLIDEVHMLSGHSFNALLKTLEEPPPHVKFLLATTDPQKLPVTILSRCLQFNLKRLTIEQIEQQLEHILSAEHIPFEENIFKPLAIAADGSMRDALSLLDQSIAYCNGSPNLPDIEAMLGSVHKDRIFELLTALANEDGRALLEQSRILTGQGIDVNTILADLITTLQRIALSQMVPDAIDDSLGDKKAIECLAQAVLPEDVQLYYQIALNGRKDLPYSPQPQGGFEMILLRMLAFKPENSGDKQKIESPVNQSQPHKQSSVQATETKEAAAQPVLNTVEKKTSEVVDKIKSSVVKPQQNTQINEPLSSQLHCIDSIPDDFELPPVAAYEQSYSTERAEEQIRSLPIIDEPSLSIVCQPENNSELANYWHDLINRAKITGLAQQLAKHCALVNQTEQNEVHKLELLLESVHKHLCNDKIKRRLVDTLQPMFNSTLKLDIKECQVKPEEQLDTPRRREIHDAEVLQQQAVESIFADPKVEMLINAFAGKIREETIKPV